MSIRIELKVRARNDAPPAFLLGSTLRGGAAQDFLPPDYVRVEAAYEVAGAERAAATGVQLKADQVLVLELADGTSLVTSAERLHAVLRRTHPELLSEDGAVRLDLLQQEGAPLRGRVGEAAGGALRRVVSLVVGEGADDDLLQHAKKILAEWVKARGSEASSQFPPKIGVSWLGTKALMWAIENRLQGQPGRLYDWSAGSELPSAAWQGPVTAPAGARYLVFVHGTASNTLGSFGDLAAVDGLWARLRVAYGHNILAFEHRTLSESPIENALQLVQALPVGARLSLVTHSRGGMVGDLLCLTDLDVQANGYRYGFPGVGPVDAPAGQAEAETHRVLRELQEQHDDQRQSLRRLATELRQRRIVVERYVRVASPAEGTKLASGNIDVFLSGLLMLLGATPGLAGQPLYAAFARVVLEIARNRTNPHLVPGIEAMLPESPLAALLQRAQVQQPPVRLALVAGDIEGGNLLTRFGVALTDFLLFDNVDHDLVVHTESMLGGIAAQSQARVLFDRGTGVNHFRYFGNASSNRLMARWLLEDAPIEDKALRPLPARYTSLDALGVVARRSADPDAPVVVLLPGIMGSYLDVEGERVWLDIRQLFGGGLHRICWGRRDVVPGGLFASTYGDICDHLAQTHQVELFPYDWRQPLDRLGAALATRLQQLLAQSGNRPIRLLAHSMGGLVVRSCIHQNPTLMRVLMARPGARLVMLGTPHQGSHAMVENLLGKGDSVRNLARFDLRNDLQATLDLVGGFRGALQLLPRWGFRDTFQGDPAGGQEYAWQQRDTWTELKNRNRDFWFGNGIAGVPEQAALDEGNWLWAQDDAVGGPRLPEEFAAQTCYVFGEAPNTPCGLRWDDSVQPPRLRMVATKRGDGTVTWDSGRIPGISRFYWMRGVRHGDLLSAGEYFDAITGLLVNGTTQGLYGEPSALRSAAADVPVAYDPAPPVAPEASGVAAAFIGTGLPRGARDKALRRLAIRVVATDLRFIDQPILVGHYEQDPLSGPEALIDSELLGGELQQRRQLGVYPGAIGTALAVLRTPHALELRRGSLRGAVVIGLGPLNGMLGFDELRVAVRAGVLRYLLQTRDQLGQQSRDLALAVLLIGHNSAATISIADSLEALVRGTLEANAAFHEKTGLDLQVACMEVVELYLDTAISAAYELRHLGTRLAGVAERQGAQLECATELVQGEGWRPRLFEASSSSYWPRLIVTGSSRSVDREAAPQPSGPRIAEQLRFLYVGQRARVEAEMQQRQPGLLEELVAQQASLPSWSPEFSRMLFQLVLPNTLKAAVRHMARMVVVVDRKTATLPWEMMLCGTPAGSSQSEDMPLAVRTPMVRQLVAPRYRANPREVASQRALVIGNPSTAGFEANFLTLDGKPAAKLATLPKAEDEARVVRQVLERAGYEVTPRIGSAWEAQDVITALLTRQYRIVHISAHGVFEQPHADRRPRTGVVLSHGMLITATEIAAMEEIPELVVLSCCHLGQLGPLQEPHHFAASLATELIEMGVRCVLVAGWAVNDQLAHDFGAAFYQALVTRRRPFGEAVREARWAIWKESHGAGGRDTTWGAFQAYGDPSWQLDFTGAYGVASDEPGLVSPDELLDQLAQVRGRVARVPSHAADELLAAQAVQVDDLLKRAPTAWHTLPYVRSALAATWLQLQQEDRARKEYLAAVQAYDALGRVPIRDIEQLASSEARLGAKQARAEIEGGAGNGARGLRQVERAIVRLEQLNALVREQTDPPLNGERAALLASAWKRKAWVLALRRVHRTGGVTRKRLREALLTSASHYARAGGLPSNATFNPYYALNRLLLEALVKPAHFDAHAAVALARECGAHASRAFAERRGPPIWNAAMQAEAELAAAWASGQWPSAAELRAPYEQALGNVPARPWELESILEQVQILGDCAQALGEDEAGRQLAQLVDVLQALAGAPRSVQPEPVALPARAERVFLFGGYRDNPPDCTTPRPPVACPPVERKKIREWMEQWKLGPEDVAIGCAASGADLLFAQEALRRGMPVHLVLPLPPTEFIARSVEPAGRIWVARFHAASAASTVHQLAPTRLNQTPEEAFARASAWMVEQGCMIEAKQRYLLCILDGAASGGRGGTSCLEEQARTAKFELISVELS